MKRRATGVLSVSSLIRTPNEEGFRHECQPSLTLGE
jgi:hypothetical protein